MNIINECMKYINSDNTAIVFGKDRISYGSLFENAMRFASYLRDHKIDRVIIKTARSANAVTAALGVMFSGGVFAFLANIAPETNDRSAASDMGEALIVHDDIDFSVFPAAPDGFTPVQRADSDPICAVFTSGSTGRPKGSLLTYRGLCETVTWQTEYMKLPPYSHTASYAEFSFIAFFWELWYPLANGFTLHIVDQQTRLDMNLLTHYIDHHHISYIFLPSDVAEIFTSVYGCGALRYLRVAGGRLAACEEPKGYEILYSLGMSENSGSVTFYPIKAGMSGDIPIGKAFGATEIYLIDGEMAVSGPSLFAGYAGQEELTRKVLIDNPYAGGRADYQKMYMSGDLAEWDSDGNLVYQGRRDWIVKINNVKTNPLEAERVIREMEGVIEAVVKPFYRANQSAYLACFYSGDTEPDTIALQLQNKLAPTSIPSYFIKMDTLPKNSNGKIDRTKLTIPETVRREYTFLSETEQDIAAAFENVLGLANGSVGPTDGFIRLGGSSLELMRLQAMLYHHEGIDLRYSDLFRAQTPRDIVNLIKESEVQSQQRESITHARTKIDTYTRTHTHIPSITPQMNMAYPLTAPERQMWLLWRTGQDNGRYTVRIQCDFEGEIDREKAEKALHKLIRKNPILCSYYRQERKHNQVQKNNDIQKQNPLTEQDQELVQSQKWDQEREQGQKREQNQERQQGLEKQQDQEKQLIYNYEQIYRYMADVSLSFLDDEISVFDLTKAPLFAAALRGNSLIFTAHHSIADAAAMRILIEDFWALYSDAPIEHAASFHDLEILEASRDLQKEELYWKQELRGQTFPALPTEMSPNGTKEYIIKFSIDELKRLKHIAAQNEVTLFILFTAAAAKLVSLIQESDTVCIGIPVSGRDLPETIRTVGMLVRTLPLVIPVEDTTMATLQTVNKKFENAFYHQNYPFELMNEMYGARYDVMVNFISYPQKLKDASGLHPRIIRSSYLAPAAKLVIDLREEENGYAAVFTYDAYRNETIENWEEAFRSILFSEMPKSVIVPKQADCCNSEGTDSEESCSDVICSEVTCSERIYSEGDDSEGICLDGDYSDGVYTKDLAEVWIEFFGTSCGNFYDLGGTSLKAIQIEEAMLFRGLYLSAADIIRVQDFSLLANLITLADEIDWEAE
jgi:bacitracin synthase 1